MFRPHVNSQELALLAERQLSHQNEAKVRRHIERCAECTYLYRQLLKIESTLSSGRTVTMPQEVAERIRKQVGGRYRTSGRRYGRRWVPALAVGGGAVVVIGIIAFFAISYLSQRSGTVNKATEAKLFGTVRFIKGSPLLISGNKTSPALASAVLRSGAELKTGDCDQALVELPDKGQILLNFDSRVRVSKATDGEGSRGSTVELLKGQVWAWSPGDGKPIIIKTALASTRVNRGEGLVRLPYHQPNGRMQTGATVELVAFRGGVDFSDPIGNRVKIPPGQSMFIEPDTRDFYPREQPLGRLLRASSVWGKRHELWQMAYLSRADLLAQLDAPRVPLGIKFSLSRGQERLHVASVAAGLAAAEAGVRPGDALLAIGGRRIETLADLMAAELLLAEGGQSSLTVQRNGVAYTKGLPIIVVPPTMCRKDDIAAIEEVASLLCQDDLEAAEATCARLVDAHPQCGAGWYDLGLIQEYAGRYREAIQSYKMATQNAPRSGAVLVALGRAYAEAGNVPRGLATLYQALDLQASAPTRYLVGRISLLDARLTEAQRQVDVLLGSSSPEDRAWGHILAGHIARLVAKDLQTAIGHLETALSLDPGNFEAIRYSAYVNLALGRPRKASELTQAVLRADPGDVRDISTMGMIAVGEQRWDEAEKWFRRGRALPVASGAFLSNLGSVCWSQEKPDEAASYFRQAIAQAPDLVPAYVYLGMTLESGDDWQLAANCYQRALELDPGDEEALDRLVALWRNHGGSEEARLVALRYGLKGEAGA